MKERTRKGLSFMLVVFVLGIALSYFIPPKKVIDYQGDIQIGNMTYHIKDSLERGYCEVDDFRDDMVCDNPKKEYLRGYTHLNDSEVWIRSGQTYQQLLETCRHEMCHTEQTMQCIREHNCEEECYKKQKEPYSYPVCFRVVEEIKERGTIEEVYSTIWVVLR